MNNLSVSDLQLLADALGDFSSHVLEDLDAPYRKNAFERAERMRFLLARYEDAALLQKRVHDELFERSKGGVK